MVLHNPENLFSERDIIALINYPYEENWDNWPTWVLTAEVIDGRIILTGLKIKFDKIKSIGE